MCAARDERAFAVLSLPADAREAEAAAHVAALLPASGRRDSGRAGVLPIDTAEARVLSFGALYHPWVIEADALRVVPPDGAATGRIAGRTLARGAWIAPANEPLDGVLGLDPERSGLSSGVLAGLDINPLMTDPRGVIVNGAHTLSLDEELEAIGVRRLLILLRRLVLRDGTPLVFEPNSPQLRAHVARQLEAILAGLFARGAFAGETEAQAFRVRTDESVNPASLVDDGRFLAEIQIAPSRPMAFIHVRLTLDESGTATFAEGF
jgi:phage tail sheath protein FI